MFTCAGFDHDESGLRSTTTYEIQGGGRMFPPVSREVGVADTVVGAIAAIQFY